MKENKKETWRKSGVFIKRVFLDDIDYLLNVWDFLADFILMNKKGFRINKSF